MPLDAGSAISIAGASGFLSAMAIKSPELLKEIYGDLAKPGVRQVGQAIGDLLGLGATVLIPLRLLTATFSEFEKRCYERLAMRFSSIEDENIIAVTPEIGVPLLERLSYSSDEHISSLYIELLATAADKSKVDDAHPSFVNVIANLCPDEARILTHFSEEIDSIPFIEVRYTAPDHFKIKYDLVSNFPNLKINMANVPLYLSNLSALGIIHIDRNKSLQMGDYDNIIRYAQDKLNVLDKMEEAGITYSVAYERCAGMLLPYGQRFIKSCTGQHVVQV